LIVLETYTPYTNKITVRDTEAMTVAPFPTAGMVERETPLGNLLAEAVRVKFKVDAAFVPSGAITGVLPAGATKVGDAINTIGGYTRQQVIMARASGAQLRAMLKRTGATPGCEMQIAGIGEVDGVLYISDEPLRDDAFYFVAAASYFIQGQLPGKKDVANLNDDCATQMTQEAVVELLRGHTPAEPATA
jgi:2',3'-cyclic-nucleotide 2'-phosphodiesterase (5'-nucleotidase family)